MLKMFFLKSQAVNSAMVYASFVNDSIRVVYYRFLSNGSMTQDQVNLDLALKLIWVWHPCFKCST